MGNLNLEKPADSENVTCDSELSPRPNTDSERIANSSQKQRRKLPRIPRKSWPSRRGQTPNSVPVSVRDLHTPNNQDGKKKKARKSKMLDAERTPDEPEEKRAKFNCAICLEEFGSKPLASTKCGHIFCHECIKSALRKRSVCPNCRRTLRGATAYHPIFLP